MSLPFTVFSSRNGQSVEIFLISRLLWLQFLKITFTLEKKYVLIIGSFEKCIKQKKKKRKKITPHPITQHPQRSWTLEFWGHPRYLFLGEYAQTMSCSLKATIRGWNVELLPKSSSLYLLIGWPRTLFLKDGRTTDLFQNVLSLRFSIMSICTQLCPS